MNKAILLNLDLCLISGGMVYDLIETLLLVGTKARIPTDI